MLAYRRDIPTVRRTDQALVLRSSGQELEQEREEEEKLSENYSYSPYFL